MQIITFVHLYERSTDISTVFALHSAAWHFASRPFECRPEIRKPHAVRTTTSEDSGQSAASRIPALVLPFIRGRHRKKRTDEDRSESGRWQPPIGKSKPGFGITALRSASGKTGSTTLPHK